MAARPDDDARRTLAELEAKLRELERELLRGHDPEPPTPAAPTAPEPFPAADPARPDPLAAEPAPPEPFPDAEPAAPEPFPAGPELLPEYGVPQPDPLAAESVPAPEPFPDEEAPPPEPFPDQPVAAPESRAPYAEPLAAEPLAAEPGPPPPSEPPPPELDLEALADAQDLLADLRATIDELGVTAGRITVEARAVVEGHGRSLARLDLAARAAARAEEAAAEAGRVAGTVVIEAGPFAEPGPLLALRDALAAQPGTKDAYVRGVEDGRAVIEVHLAPPTAQAQGSEPPGE
jgi:hypothetical protein